MSAHLRHAFRELYETDGLCVMGRGLGLWRLLSKFIRVYSRKDEASSARRLVFCVNAARNAEEAQPLLDALLGDGVAPRDLPRVVTNESYGVAERHELYKRGGVFIVTSRILVLDFINSEELRHMVAGLLMYDAHRVNETSAEAFIVRLYREKNQRGFLKAFSNAPERLLHGFGALEKTMKHLQLQKLYLWPRFHAIVLETIGGGGSGGGGPGIEGNGGSGMTSRVIGGRDADRCEGGTVRHGAASGALGADEGSIAVAPPSAKRRKGAASSRSLPEVVQLDCLLSPLQQRIQEGLVAAMELCLGDLRRSCPALDASEMTVERGIFRPWHSTVRRQLDGEWHRLSPKTKQVVGDLKTLRELLEHLIRCDACTFYQLLLALRSINSHLLAEGKLPSPWLSTSAADAVFRCAKDRVFRIEARRDAPVELVDIAGDDDSGDLDAKEARAAPGGNVAVLRDAVQSRARLGHGKRRDIVRQRCIKRVLEQNPKWQVLAEVLAQVRGLCAPSDADGRRPIGGSRCIVVVRDDATKGVLQRFLCSGGQELMMDRYRRLLRQCNARSRRLHASRSAKRRARRGGASAPPPPDRKTSEGLMLASMSAEQILMQEEERALGTGRGEEEAQLQWGSRDGGGHSGPVARGAAAASSTEGKDPWRLRP